jgi:hypothetical protein
MHRHEMQQSNIYLGIYTIEYYFLLEKSGCYRWPQPHHWRWHSTRLQHWSRRWQSAARQTRSPMWSDECLGSQPSRRRCRQPGQSWTSGAIASQSQATHEDSARCTSWPSSGAPEGHACAGRSAARHKRCWAV